MKKFGCVVVLVLAVALVPVVLTAQSSIPRGKDIDRQPIGVIKAVSVDQFNLDGVTGIQKTINIPAFSFVADQYGYGCYYDYYYGYIEGLNASYHTECLAPVILPKGAKKIAAIYWVVYDTTGNQYLGFYKNTFGGTYPTQLVGGYTNAYSSWMYYIWAPAKTSWITVNPTDFFYVEFWANAYGYLQECLIIYK